MNVRPTEIDGVINFYINFGNKQLDINTFLRNDVLMDSTKEQSIMLIVYEKANDNIIGIFVCVEKEQNNWFVQYYGNRYDEISRNQVFLTKISTFISSDRHQEQYFEQNRTQIWDRRQLEITNRHTTEMSQLQSLYQQKFNEGSKILEQQQLSHKIPELNTQLMQEMGLESQHLSIQHQAEKNFFTRYPLFAHEEQKLLHDNFIQVIFQRAKITQIGRMSDRVFVQEYQHVSESMKQQYVDFLRINCKFEWDENVSENEKILIFFSTEETSNNITGFQLIKYNYISGIAERYSSCTKDGQQYRGKGIMKKIDNTAVIYMQIKFPGLKYIWTGLKAFYAANADGSLNTELTKKEAKRKIRSGFGWDLQISKVSPLNNPAPFRFISFYWKPNSVFTLRQLSASFDKVSKLIDDFPKTLYIPLSVVNHLKQYREHYPNQEYGGHGERDKFTGEIPNLQLEALSNNIDRLVDGQPVICDVPFTLDGNHLFSFHTHPDGCYRAYQHEIGWPSSADLHMVLRLATLDYHQGITLDRISTIHFVIAREGIYSIRLSREFVNYYRTFDANKYQTVRNLIDYDINQVSNARSNLDTLIIALNKIKGLNHSIDEDFMILQALNEINKFSLTIDNNNIPVFKVTFERYENIMSDIRFTRY